MKHAASQNAFFVGTKFKTSISAGFHEGLQWYLHITQPIEDHKPALIPLNTVYQKASRAKLYSKSMEFGNYNLSISKGDPIEIDSSVILS